MFSLFYYRSFSFYLMISTYDTDTSTRREICRRQMVLFSFKKS